MQIPSWQQWETHVSVSIIGGARASSGSPAERSPVVAHWRFVRLTAVDSQAGEMSKRDIRRFLIVNIMVSIHNYTVGILRLLGSASALGRADRDRPHLVGQRFKNPSETGETKA